MLGFQTNPSLFKAVNRTAMSKKAENALVAALHVVLTYLPAQQDIAIAFKSDQIVHFEFL